MTARSLPALIALAGLTVAGLALAATGPARADDLVAKGEHIFHRCKACHTLVPGRNRVGPSLAGVIGRTAGTAPGFRYSGLSHDAGEAGLVWTPERITDYLKDPTAFLIGWLKDHGEADEAHGRSRMTLKLPRKSDREAVVAYLKSLAK